MSQKSSVPQAVSFVSQVLKRDRLSPCRRRCALGPVLAHRYARGVPCPGPLVRGQLAIVLGAKDYAPSTKPRVEAGVPRRRLV